MIPELLLGAAFFILSGIFAVFTACPALRALFFKLSLVSLLNMSGVINKAAELTMRIVLVALLLICVDVIVLRLVFQVDNAAIKSGFILGFFFVALANSRNYRSDEDNMKSFYKVHEKYINGDAVSKLYDKIDDRFK